MMGGMSWTHRLFEINPETKTGVCSSCGPVDLKWRAHRKQWSCREAERIRNRKVDPLKYGLTRSERADLIARGCEICGSTSDVGIDHDHASGAIRAPLCRYCNLGLGYFRDKPDRLLAAAEYLKRF